MQTFSSRWKRRGTNKTGEPKVEPELLPKHGSEVQRESESSGTRASTRCGLDGRTRGLPPRGAAGHVGAGTNKSMELLEAQLLPLIQPPLHPGFWRFSGDFLVFRNWANPQTCKTCFPGSWTANPSHPATGCQQWAGKRLEEHLPVSPR